MRKRSAFLVLIMATFLVAYAVLSLLLRGILPWLSFGAAGNQQSTIVINSEKKDQQQQQNNHTLINRYYYYVDDIVRDDNIRRWAAKYAQKSPRYCHGKEPFLEILFSAWTTTTSLSSSFITAQIPSRLCQQLPTVEQVTALYGEEVVVIGMDTCATFRANVAKVRDEVEEKERKNSDGLSPQRGRIIAPMVRVAGLYQSGTNAMAFSLAHNLQHNEHELEHNNNNHNHNKNVSMGVSPPPMTNRDEDFNVPWGKHVPIKYWQQNQITMDATIDPRLILPIVMVRDPYRWMLSMCRESYDAQWLKRGFNKTCPYFLTKNQIANDGTLAYNNVTVHWERRFVEHYRTLADLWSVWNREYWHLDIPRLIVRVEDLWFHGEKLLQLISECSGIPLRQRPFEGTSSFQYLWEPSKTHGRSSNLLTALSKYGKNPRGRYDAMTAEDFAYAKNGALDPTLMQLFRYPHEVQPRRVKHGYRKKVQRYGNGY